MEGRFRCRISLRSFCGCWKLVTIVTDWIHVNDYCSSLKRKRQFFFTSAFQVYRGYVFDTSKTFGWSMTHISSMSTRTWDRKWKQIWRMMVDSVRFILMQHLSRLHPRSGTALNFTAPNTNCIFLTKTEYKHFHGKVTANIMSVSTYQSTSAFNAIFTLFNALPICRHCQDFSQHK